MLPLCGSLTKPAIICDIDEEIGVAIHIFTSKVGKHIFKTNQHRCFDWNIWQLEWHSTVTGREPALNRRKPLHNREPPFERNVFPENHQGTFAITAHEFSL